MIRPAFRFIMPLRTARIARNAPLRFASSTMSQSLSLIRSTIWSRVRPALFTRMSIGPRAASAAAQLGRRGPGPVGVPAGDGDPRPRAAERLGDGPPDTAGPAGDQGHFARQVDGVHPTFQVRGAR